MSPTTLGALRSLQRIIDVALEDLHAIYEASGSISFPLLDEPYDPHSSGEKIAAADPDASRAISLVVAAASQLSASVQHPFLTLCDAAMGYQLPACLRVFEAIGAIEIMQQKGKEGVSVDVLADSVRGGGIDKRRLAHILRLLATHHIITELSPGNVFALNRISGCLVSHPASPPPKTVEEDLASAECPSKLQGALSSAMDSDIRDSELGLGLCFTDTLPSSPFDVQSNLNFSPCSSPVRQMTSPRSSTQSVMDIHLSSPLSLDQAISSSSLSSTTSYETSPRSPFHSSQCSKYSHSSSISQVCSPNARQHTFKFSLSPQSTPIRDIDLENLLATPPSSFSYNSNNSPSPILSRKPLLRSAKSYAQMMEREVQKQQQQQPGHAKTDSAEIRGADSTTSPKKSPVQRKRAPLSFGDMIDPSHAQSPPSLFLDDIMSAETGTLITGNSFGASSNTIPFPRDGPSNFSPTTFPAEDKGIIFENRGKAAPKLATTPAAIPCKGYPSPPLSAVSARPPLASRMPHHKPSRSISPFLHEEHGDQTQLKKLQTTFTKPEDKYVDTNGVAAFIGLCTDELFKSSAFLLESLLPIPQYELETKIEHADTVHSKANSGKAETPPPSNLARPAASSSDTVSPVDRPSFVGKTKQTLETACSPAVEFLAPFNHAFDTKRGYFAWLEESAEGFRTPSTVGHSMPLHKHYHGQLNEREQQFRLARFGRAMTGSTSWEGVGGVWNALDWQSLPQGSLVVDVGGGIGSTSVLLAQDLSEKVKFVVQDRPPVVKLGEETMRKQCPELLESGIVTFQVHDFFEQQPETTRGADVYFLRVVLHDWPDRDAKHILRRLRDSVMEGKDTKLVIADFVLPLACVGLGDDAHFEDRGIGEGDSPLPWIVDPAPAAPLLANLGKANANAYWLDITMQSMFNSQERTLSEMTDLCGSAGWKVISVRRGAGSLFGYVVAVPSILPPESPESADELLFNCLPDVTQTLPVDVNDAQSNPDVPQRQEQRPLQRKKISNHLSDDRPRSKRAPSRCSTPTFGSVAYLPSTTNRLGPPFYNSSCSRVRGMGTGLSNAPALKGTVRRMTGRDSYPVSLPNARHLSPPPSSTKGGIKALSSSPTILTPPRKATLSNASLCMTITTPPLAGGKGVPRGEPKITATISPTSSPTMTFLASSKTTSKRARRGTVPSIPLAPPPQRGLPPLPKTPLLNAASSTRAAPGTLRRDRRVTVSSQLTPALPITFLSPINTSFSISPTRLNTSKGPDSPNSFSTASTSSSRTVSGIPVPITPRQPLIPYQVQQRSRRATISTQSATFLPAPSLLPLSLTSRSKLTRMPSSSALAITSLLPVPSTPQRNAARTKASPTAASVSTPSKGQLSLSTTPSHIASATSSSSNSPCIPNCPSSLLDSQTQPSPLRSPIYTSKTLPLQGQLSPASPSSRDKALPMLPARLSEAMRKKSSSESLMMLTMNSRDSSLSSKRSISSSRNRPISTLDENSRQVKEVREEN